MDVQGIENNADFRIKFASINEKGGYDSDAMPDVYRKIFHSRIGKLTDEWSYEQVEGLIET